MTTVFEQIKATHEALEATNTALATYSLVELKKLFTGRVLFVRCNEARFIITKATLLYTCQKLGSNVVFEAFYNDKQLFVENVIQVK